MGDQPRRGAGVEAHEALLRHEREEKQRFERRRAVWMESEARQQDPKEWGEEEVRSFLVLECKYPSDTVERVVQHVANGVCLLSLPKPECQM